jgi:hypothetical protein
LVKYCDVSFLSLFSFLMKRKSDEAAYLEVSLGERDLGSKDELVAYTSVPFTNISRSRVYASCILEVRNSWTWLGASSFPSV